MKKYIIYTWLGSGNVLYPNHIVARDENEAFEVLCASPNTTRKFIRQNELTKQEFDLIKYSDRYTFVDTADLGKGCGFLLTEKMIIEERGDAPWEIDQ